MIEPAMLEPLFVLLQNLPCGLLLAALLLECFIVAKNRREVEPAVLDVLERRDVEVLQADDLRLAPDDRVHAIRSPVPVHAFLFGHAACGLEWHEGRRKAG